MRLDFIRKIKQMNNDKGFTLVEVLAAVTLMAVSLILLAQMMNYNLKNNKDSGNISTANNLAQAKIEEYRTKSITPVTTGRIEEPSTPITGFPKFSRKVELVDPTTASGNTSAMVTVKVTVTWQDVNGNNKSVILQTKKIQ